MRSGWGGSGSRQAPAQQAPQPAVIRPEHRLAAERAANGRQQVADADRATFLEKTARTIAEREATKLREPGFEAPNAVDPDRELEKEMRREQAQGLMKRIAAGAKYPEMMGDLYADSSQRKAQGRAGMQDKLLADYGEYQKLRSDYKAEAHNRAEGEYSSHTIKRKTLKDGDLLKEMLVPNFDASQDLNDIMAGVKIKHGYYRVPRKIKKE